MKLELDGKFTKLLKAYALLLELEHTIECRDSAFGVGLSINLYAKTKWYDSVVDVFEEGKLAYVSSLCQYRTCVDAYLAEDIAKEIEALSKKMLLETFGERRYLKSMKGGGVVLGTGEAVPKFEVRNLPKSLEELEIRLDLAGIDWEKCNATIRWQH